MIAKVYYAVGVLYVRYETEETLMELSMFPGRIFDRDELPQAEREYSRLEKRNYSDDSGYQIAYLIKILGDQKEVLRGDANIISSWL